MSLGYTSLALFSTLLVIVFSSLPDRLLWAQNSLRVQLISNLCHIPGFALLTYLWLKSFAKAARRRHSGFITWSVLAAITIFAVLDEIHQLVVPGRSASLIDFGLDLVGVLAGLAMFRFSDT